MSGLNMMASILNNEQYAMVGDKINQKQAWVMPINIDRVCVSAFTNVHRLFKVRAQTVASNASMYFKKYVCL